MQKKLAIKDQQIEKHLFKQRLFGLVLFVALINFIMLLRLGYLQLIEHQFYSTLSNENLLNILPEPPKRGLIYDRNGVLLADNSASYTLALIPSKIEKLDTTLANLQKIMTITPEDIQLFKKIQPQYHPFQPIPLRYKLSEKEVDAFLVDQFQFPGVELEASLIRTYPLAALTSNVVGYVGRINTDELNKVDNNNYSGTHYIGKVGIEKQYETLLHGTVGTHWVEIDAAGHSVRNLTEHPAIPGGSIYLTLDSALQKTATEALGKEQGAVVAIDPNNGEVLAMATNPNYDPNPFVLGLSNAQYQGLINSSGNPLFNRPIRGEFAAGSTVKPFIALNALSTGIVDTQYTIHDPGYFQLPGSDHLYHDWRPYGHGIVNVSKAITESCDTYFYNLAVKMGIDQLDQALTQFGFGQATHIDMPEELPGLVPSPAWKLATHGQRWYAGDTVITGIGQGFLLSTPLQLAVSTAILAERGKYYQTHLVKKIIATDGSSTETQPILLNNLSIKPEVWQTVVNAMQNVVTAPNGNAYRSFGHQLDYTVAAKTGTAQVKGRNREETQSEESIPYKLRNNHLFIAFAPVDHPQIAIAVVVEHSARAAQVARQVLDYYLLTERHLWNNQPHDKMPMPFSTEDFNHDTKKTTT